MSLMGVSAEIISTRGGLLHLGIDDVGRDLTAHIAVANEEDVGVEGLEHCAHGVSVRERVSEQRARCERHALALHGIMSWG
jgi:hypothetical protein